MNEYIVADRTDGNNYAISIADNELLYTITLDAASSEPIVRDKTNASDYWKIFIDDGQMGFETTLTEQDDDLTLTDTVTGALILIAIADGEMRLQDGSIQRITDNILVRYINDDFVLIRKTISDVHVEYTSTGRLAT